MILPGTCPFRIRNRSKNVGDSGSEAYRTDNPSCVNAHFFADYKPDKAPVCEKGSGGESIVGPR
jgi:hypothetical protein